MPSDITRAAGPVLGFDTSGGWIAAALVQDGRVLTAEQHEMARGQGEALMPLLESLLAAAGAGWSDLAAIGCGIGPGNFTGIRLSVAAARGLALGLGIPAIGVTRFEALALDGPAVTLAVPALRGQVWLLAPGGTPVIADSAPPDSLGADLAPVHPVAVATALIAESRRHSPQPRPAPLYLREADAAPASEPPPVLIDR